MTRRIVVFTSASGEPSARLERAASGDIALFSAYAPRREAERFVAEALRDKRPAAVVVLGAGLGYLEAAAAKAVPQAAVFPVYYADELAPPLVREGWRPGCGRSLSDFLERALTERDPRSVEVIEWPAAACAFPELARQARAETLRVLRENAASELSIAGSGRRWLRNSLANFLLLDAPLSGNPLDPGKPLVIAAAGPSLSAALPLLIRHRGRISLWALSSSLAALGSRGLAPDLAVATDAGYYASRLLLRAPARIPVLAMPLSGARGAWRAAERVFLFAQPNFFELELFRRGRAAVPAVDAHGTVAGTALLLARACGARTVFFCGLDFCWDDIRSHAAPHASQDQAEQSSIRLEPAYGRTFGRALAFAPCRIDGSRRRTADALSVYAGSFREPCAGAGMRVFRLFPSPVEVPGMIGAGAAELEEAVGARRGGENPAGLSPLRGYPDAGERRRIVRALLDEWLEDIAAGRPRPELARFFSGRPAANGKRTEVSSDSASGAARLRETADFLRSLRGRYTNAEGRFHA
jgi:hypothetical protein